MSGIQKTESQATSNLNKVLIPIIRRIIPSTIAGGLLGVQPMTRASGTIFNIKYWDWHNKIRQYPPFMSTMVYMHIATRDFMPEWHTEPNDYYRPWLEENIGKQGIDWNWNLNSNNINFIDIGFASKEHATLFELTWP